MAEPVTDDLLAPLTALPGVVEALDATRAAMDGLLREPALRRGRSEVRAAARIRSAWASARLAGCALPWEAFEPPFDDDDEGHLAASALNVAGEVGASAETWRRAPLQSLARLHAVAMAGQVAAETLGRPRPEPAVGVRLATLAEVVTTTRAPGLLVSAVVHGELLTLRPFGSGDDLVARAASRVVLVARGVDPDALTVPEMGLLDLGIDDYAAAADGYATGTPEGLARWVTFHAASVQRGIAVARTLCR